MDFGKSVQGAGGIGGLLARSQASVPNPRHAYYHADGNGNITALVNTNGILLAQYSYDPFGGLLTMSGPLAVANRYRFSSKEWDDRTGLYYYGYRFYDPLLQRWVNADPIGEDGGINLYGFVENNPENLFDGWGYAPPDGKDCNGDKAKNSTDNVDTGLGMAKEAIKDKTKDRLLDQLPKRVKDTAKAAGKIASGLDAMDELDKKRDEANKAARNYNDHSNNPTNEDDSISSLDPQKRLKETVTPAADAASQFLKSGVEVGKDCVSGAISKPLKFAGYFFKSQKDNSPNLPTPKAPNPSPDDNSNHRWESPDGKQWSPFQPSWGKDWKQVH